MVLESLYCLPEVCALVNGKKSKFFHVGVIVFGKGMFCHFFFSQFILTGWTSSAEPTSVSRLEDATLVGRFLQMV